MRKGGNLRRSTALLPTLFLIFLVGVAPFLTVFKDSFYHDSYDGRSFAGVSNFLYILGDQAFSYSLNITVLWAFLNVILTLVLGFLVALRLVSFQRNGSFLHRFMLIPWGIPVYIAVPLWRAFLHGNGGDSIITRFTGVHINLMMDPLSGFSGALLVSLWMNVPISAFVFASHMRKVSRSVIEAARLDGAGESIIARYIYYPEIRESLLAMGVLSFIKSFKEFSLVFMLTAGGPPLISGITERHILGATTTLGVFLYEVFLQTNDWGINAAYALIMAVFVIFIMTLWILIKRNNSGRPILFLCSLVLIPGGNPVLWCIGTGYLLIVLFQDEKSRFFPWVALIHLLYTLFRVYSLGFLRGGHPGIMLPLIVFFMNIQTRKTGVMDQPGLLYSSSFSGFNTPSSIKGYKTTSWIVSVLFMFITSIILYMLIWMSFSRVSACYIDSIIPGFFTFRNFLIIFKEEGILLYFRNTLFIAGLTAALLPLIIFPTAVILDKKGSKQTLAFLGFIQILGITGGMHTLIPLYRIFRTLGLINTYVPLILIYLYHSLPFALFILTSYLKTLPPSFREQGRLEGISDTAYGFKILLPLSLPTLSTALMAAFISGWNGFQAPLLFLNDEALYTISLKLYGYIGSLGSGSPVWNLFAAVSVLNTLFIGFLFLRLRKTMTYSPVSDVDE